MLTKVSAFIDHADLEGGVKVYDAHKDKAEETFILSHPSDHIWIIEGEKALRTYSIINLSTDEGVAKLISYLDKIGVEDALRKKGAQNGDTVKIGEYEFEYND